MTIQEAETVQLALMACHNRIKELQGFLPPKDGSALLQQIEFATVIVAREFVI